METVQSKIGACICLALAMAIVGSAMVFGKIITRTFPVFLASEFRFAIASALMLPWLWCKERDGFYLSRKDVPALVFMAFCGQFVFTALVLWGLRLTSAMEAGIITATSPGVMVAISFVCLGERPGRMRWLAIALVVAGMGCVNACPGTVGQGSHLTGNLLMLGAVTGEAIFLLMRKRVSSRISNLALTTWLSVIGMGLFLPFALVEASTFDFGSVPPGAWWAVVYFGAIFTVLAYLFWFYGVARVSGSTASVFSAVMPVSAVTLSALCLNESFTLFHGAGILLVLSAILILAFTRN